jgi:23S rRNA (cytidine1920-2'-O)/16S rRNA (cytidine1409-2'-O)-methyltransferase
MAKTTKRLDAFLVEKGYFETRNLAQSAIMEGRVLVNDRKIEKAGFSVYENSEIRIIGDDPLFVSRGGLKLQAALEQFRIDVSDKICLDIGASTGGFTDCLLQDGAKKVVALDVGRGLIHNKLRQDNRVEIREGINARYIDENEFDEQFDIMTIDVSFISQKLVLPALIPHLKSGGIIVSLIKPQFEAGREKIGKGGIVRDESVRLTVVDEITEAYLNSGFELIGTMESPIKGMDGNVEYLIVVKKKKTD